MQWMEENNFGNPTTPSTFRNNPVVDGTEQRIPNNQQFRRHLDLFKSCFVFFGLEFFQNQWVAKFCKLITHESRFSRCGHSVRFIPMSFPSRKSRTWEVLQYCI